MKENQKSTKTAEGTKPTAKVTLADAQTTAKASLKSGRTGLADIATALLKAGKGKPVPVEQLAVAVGPTTTRADIRHTFQRAGLSARNEAVIESPDGKNWLWLVKNKGQNSYLIDKVGIDHSKRS